MRGTLRSKYRILNTYVLRTPLFSVEQLFELYKADCTITALWNLFKDPKVKEAIYLGSPVLYDQLIDFSINENPSIEKHWKLSIALLKYVTRLSSRPTPFGLFAGIALGRFDNKTQVVLGDISWHKRQTRLDFEYLAQLAKQLVKNLELRKILKFYPNTTLYQSAGQLRYIETSFEEQGKNYSLQRVVPNEILNAILQFVNYGQSYNSIVDFVIESDFNRNEAEDFINTLIDFQILISNLEPYTIGKDYLNHLIDELSGHDNIPSLEFLKHFKSIAEKLDQHIGNEIKFYKELEKGASRYSSTLKPGRLIQVDLYPKFENNTLSKKLKIEISSALDILSALFDPYDVDEMMAFTRAFGTRYETQTIPLVNVLDLDYGLGYPIDSNKSKYPYLENLDLGINLGNNTKSISLNKTERFLFQLVKDNPNQEIDLSQADLANFEINDPNLKATHYTMGQIFFENNSTKLFLNGFGGSSATDLLGRFSNGSLEIRAFLKEIVQFESSFYNDYVIAEIAHLPEERTGNVLFRPQLRDFQINFLSGANRNIYRDIEISDLTISLRGNRLILRSEKYDKEVVPYLSNAHNYLNSKLPIYRFLCDYQHHTNALKVGFSWGQLPKIYHHLPRVCYKNVVLAKEQWVFQIRKLKQMINRTADDSSLMSAVNKMREMEGLPQYIQLKERDNLLLIDLKNPLSVRMLLDTISNKDSNNCILVEFLHNKNDIVKDRNGKSYTNEFLFGLTRNNNGHGD